VNEKKVSKRCSRPTLQYIYVDTLKLPLAKFRNRSTGFRSRPRWYNHCDMQICRCSSNFADFQHLQKKWWCLQREATLLMLATNAMFFVLVKIFDNLLKGICSYATWTISFAAKGETPWNKPSPEWLFTKQILFKARVLQIAYINQWIAYHRNGPYDTHQMTGRLIWIKAM